MLATTLPPRHVWVAAAAVKTTFHLARAALPGTRAGQVSNFKHCWREILMEGEMEKVICKHHPGKRFSEHRVGEGLGGSLTSRV